MDDEHVALREPFKHVVQDGAVERLAAGLLFVDALTASSFQALSLPFQFLAIRRGAAIANASHGGVGNLPKAYGISTWISSMAKTRVLSLGGEGCRMF